MFQLSYDDLGHPTMSWPEFAHVTLRSLSIAERDGQAYLVVVHPQKMTVTALGVLLLILAAVFFTIWIGPALAVGIATAHPNETLLKALSVVFFVLAFPATVAVLLNLPDGFYRWRLGAPASSEAPWADLSGFVLTDEASLTGLPPDRDHEGKPKVSPLVMLADFGGLHPPIEVLHSHLPRTAAIELHRTLTLEFVTKRKARPPIAAVVVAISNVPVRL